MWILRKKRESFLVLGAIFGIAIIAVLVLAESWTAAVLAALVGVGVALIQYWGMYFSSHFASLRKTTDTANLSNAHAIEELITTQHKNELRIRQLGQLGQAAVRSVDELRVSLEARAKSIIAVDEHLRAQSVLQKNNEIRLR